LAHKETCRRKPSRLSTKLTSERSWAPS